MVVRIRLHRKSPATFPPLAKAEEEDLSPIPTAAVLHWGPLLSSPAQVGSSTRRFSSSFFFFFLLPSLCWWWCVDATWPRLEGLSSLPRSAFPVVMSSIDQPPVLAGANKFIYGQILRSFSRLVWEFWDVDRSFREWSKRVSCFGLVPCLWELIDKLFCVLNHIFFNYNFFCFFASFSNC